MKGRQSKLQQGDIIEKESEWDNTIKIKKEMWKTTKRDLKIKEKTKREAFCFRGVPGWNGMGRGKAKGK